MNEGTVSSGVALRPRPIEVQPRFFGFHIFNIRDFLNPFFLSMIWWKSDTRYWEYLELNYFFKYSHFFINDLVEK
jgi:hypothetical protein